MFNRNIYSRAAPMTLLKNIREIVAVYGGTEKASNDSWGVFSILDRDIEISPIFGPLRTPINGIKKRDYKSQVHISCNGSDKLFGDVYADILNMCFYTCIVEQLD